MTSNNKRTIIKRLSRGWSSDDDIDAYSKLKELTLGISDNEYRMDFLRIISESDYNVHLPTKESMEITFYGGELIKSAYNLLKTYCDNSVIVMPTSQYFNYASKPTGKSPLNRFKAAYNWHNVSLSCEHRIYNGVGGIVPSIHAYVNTTSDHEMIILSYVDLTYRKGFDLTSKAIDKAQLEIIKRFMVEATVITTHS